MLTILIILIVVTAVLLRVLYALRFFIGAERTEQSAGALFLVFVALSVLTVILLGGEA